MATGITGLALALATSIDGIALTIEYYATKDKQKKNIILGLLKTIPRAFLLDKNCIKYIELAWEIGYQRLVLQVCAFYGLSIALLIDILLFAGIRIGSLIYDKTRPEPPTDPEPDPEPKPEPEPVEPLSEEEKQRRQARGILEDKKNTKREHLKRIKKLKKMIAEKEVSIIENEAMLKKVREEKERKSAVVEKCNKAFASKVTQIEQTLKGLKVLMSQPPEVLEKIDIEKEKLEADKPKLKRTRKEMRERIKKNKEKLPQILEAITNQENRLENLINLLQNDIKRLNIDIMETEEEIEEIDDFFEKLERKPL